MWGIFHHAYAKDAPLHTFVIFIAVSKRIYICYKGTDRFVAQTYYTYNTTRCNFCCYILV
jgi:hypothetical protein